MSECATARKELAPFCKGVGIEMGAGGDATVPWAITMDLERPYTKVSDVPQILRGNCRDLNFICDNSLDFLVSHHLLEDFSYSDLADIIKEWRRVLKVGGLLVTNCPTQQKFLAHIQKTGQPNNLAHKEQDFSLENFSERVIAKTGAWKLVWKKDEHGPYSFLIVFAKV